MNLTVILPPSNQRPRSDLLSWSNPFFSTASHLPFNRNGMKFFTNTGGTGKADITDILARAAKIYDGFTEESLEKSAQAAASATSEVDYMKRYTADLVEAVRKGAGGVGEKRLF